MLFGALFMLIAFVGMRINFSSLVGTENQFFTLYQFFGPIAGGFLGSPVGAVIVFGAQVIDGVMSGKTFDVITIARLLPMMFAAYYFGVMTRRSKQAGESRDYLSIIVPLIAMAVFIAHPVGRQVWYFSLYWLIPIVVRMLPDSVRGKLLLNSLGATFTAHAVGGAIWAWTIPMTPAAWIALIPVVAYERLLFAGGIAGSYLVMRSVVSWIEKRLHVSLTEHAQLRDA